MKTMMNSDRDVTKREVARGLRGLCLATAASAALLLGGCSTWDRMSSADKGTAVGATGGAVVGNAVGGGALGTVGGAVVGGAVGREVGKRNP
jgi:osmotically inducible lipoprotein OsmB